MHVLFIQDSTIEHCEFNYIAKVSDNINELNQILEEFNIALVKSFNDLQMFFDKYEPQAVDIEAMCGYCTHWIDIKDYDAYLCGHLTPFIKTLNFRNSGGKIDDSCIKS